MAGLDPTKKRPHFLLQILRGLFFAFVVALSVILPIADVLLTILFPMRDSEHSAGEIQNWVRSVSLPSDNPSTPGRDQSKRAALPLEVEQAKLNNILVSCPFTRSHFDWRSPPKLPAELADEPQFFAWSHRKRWDRKYLVFEDRIVLVPVELIDWKNQILILPNRQ